MTKRTYYEMILPDGSKRSCGTMKDVENMLRIYPTASYTEVTYNEVPNHN